MKTKPWGLKIAAKTKSLTKVATSKIISIY